MQNSIEQTASRYISKVLREKNERYVTIYYGSDWRHIVVKKSQFFNVKMTKTDNILWI